MFKDFLDLCGAEAGHLRFRRAPRGTVLWEPGDPADFAFLLVTGYVEEPWLTEQVVHSCPNSGKFWGSLRWFLMKIPCCWRYHLTYSCALLSMFFWFSEWAL